MPSHYNPRAPRHILARALAQSAETSRRAKRAPLENVGRSPLALRQRLFAAVEVSK